LFFEKAGEICRVKYKAKLPKINNTGNGRCYIKLGKLNAACAELFINGKNAGVVFTSPLELDITEHYKPGANLEIILYSSLRNLLGPHHNTFGEIPWASPYSFLLRPARLLRDDIQFFFR